MSKPRMAEITVYFKSDVKTVWNVLTNNEAYKWRSDIKKIETTKGKVFEIIDKYNQIQREIHTHYKWIDFRTAEGDKCFKEFAKVHDAFNIELNKLSEIQR
jgi:hypothetical protein